MLQEPTNSRMGSLKDGGQTIAELQASKEHYLASKKKRADVDAQYQKISRLRSLEPIYTEREYEMIHLLAKKRKK